MSRRAGLAGAVLCLGLLAAVRGGGGGPPLYDGVCLPPQYTMLGANPGPPLRSQTFTASDLASTFELADNDSTPQAQIIVAAGGLIAPPGAATATVTITPVKPPAIKPADGTIDGNVYDFEVTAAGQRLQVMPGHLVTIVLSATAVGGAQRQVEHFDGTRWSAPAKSVQSGCGTTYQVNSTTLGVFALVAQGTGTPSNGGGAPGGGGPTVVIVIVVVVVVLAVVIGAVRINRQRGRGGKRRRR